MSASVLWLHVYYCWILYIITRQAADCGIGPLVQQKLQCVGYLRQIKRATWETWMNQITYRNWNVNFSCKRFQIRINCYHSEQHYNIKYITHHTVRSLTSDHWPEISQARKHWRTVTGALVKTCGLAEVSLYEQCYSLIYISPFLIFLSALPDTNKIMMMINNHLIANLLVSVPVNEFWKTGQYLMNLWKQNNNVVAYFLGYCV